MAESWDGYRTSLKKLENGESCPGVPRKSPSRADGKREQHSVDGTSRYDLSIFD